MQYLLVRWSNIQISAKYLVRNCAAYAELNTHSVRARTPIGLL
jgi:hypothetical protein